MGLRQILQATALKQLGGAGATAFEAVAQHAGQLLLAGSVAVQPGNATNPIGLHAIYGGVLFQALPIGWAVARL